MPKKTYVDLLTDAIDDCVRQTVELLVEGEGLDDTPEGRTVGTVMMWQTIANIAQKKLDGEE
jgi:hypothetical protein